MKEQIEAVQRMQDYIESHWQESITLADLSKASHFSPWYSARLFRKLTGLSPADYIRRYKLSRSALRLRDEDCKVIDVAFDLGFGSVDGYQRAFLREFGCNPRAFMRCQRIIGLYFPPIKDKVASTGQLNMLLSCCVMISSCLSCYCLRGYYGFGKYLP